MPIIFPRFPKVVLTGDADPGNVMVGKTFYKDDPKQKLTGSYVPAAPPVLDGDAATGDVLAGKTFYNTDAYTKETGTLSLSGNAGAGDVLSGKTFYSNNPKSKLTGNIPSKAAATITPGTTNQVIAAGQYLSGAQTIAGSANLVPGNIKNGVNIFGIVGTLIEGKAFVIGTKDSNNSESTLTVTGLPFEPNIIIAIYEYDSDEYSVGLNGVFGLSATGVRRGSGGYNSASLIIYSDGFRIGVGRVISPYNYIAFKL